MSEQRAVTLTRRELEVALRVATEAGGDVVTIREQRLETNDAQRRWGFNMGNDDTGDRRAYVVTVRMPEQPGDDPAGNREPDLQYLMLSGPALAGPIDLVLLQGDARVRHAT